MRNLSELGIQRSGNVTDEMINVIQKQLGVKFPDEYLMLVRYNDEAVPVCNIIAFQNEETSIDTFFKFTSDKNELFGILSYGNIPGFPGGMVPFARDPGDGYFCFDFANSCQISFYNPDNGKWTFVAKSFGEFLEMLKGE